MGKKVLKIFATAILACVAIYWVNLWFFVKPLTLEEARRVAIKTAERDARHFGYDLGIFTGPELTNQGPHLWHGRPWAYLFKWKYSDEKGTVTPSVDVDLHGDSHFSFDGDLERLRTRPRPRQTFLEWLRDQYDL
mgnify:FL=1